MPKPLHESRQLAEAAVTADRKSGRMTVQVMTPGWGTSGYYSPAVCEAAAALMPEGTKMYLDHRHQDGSGLDERGNRSLRDLAAVLTESARWDAAAQAVVAECSVTAPYREFLCDEYVAPHVGLSINGAASDIAVGEAEGRTGPIVESVAVIDSVDFVSRAGRGGKVLAVLESGLPDQVVARAVGHGIAEATADERRQQLSDAVRTAYAGTHRYAWVRDFDDTTVWFEASAEDEPSKTWQQTYDVAADDLAVVLTGARVEVRPVTRYVTTTRSDSTTTTATESREDTMPKIQIEESEHNRLTETAGRVDALESENATLKAENTQLKEADAARGREARAREIVGERAAEAKVAFDDLQVAGLVAHLPVKESDGAAVLDEDAFTATVDAAAKRVAEAATAGAASGPTGFGASATTEVTESGPRTKSPWGRPLTESKGA